MKSLFSGIGILIVVLILFVFGDIKELIERHLFSIICLFGAIGAFVLYLRSDSEDADIPLPPDKFEG